MSRDEFLHLLTEEVKDYENYLETTDKEWIIKGFIDTDRNIYTITNDTKVVSKIIEILMIPRLDMFAKEHGLTLELPSKQNYYPDMTFKDTEGHLFAVDFKSSYYSGSSVNGLTLGSYWGYFRNRDKVMNMDYSYNSYSCHLVLGMLYKQTPENVNEYTVYNLQELGLIHSVISHFIFFVQPKWKIANDIPGSGNTRNIGGITDIKSLIEGNGPFSELGEDIFDDYWTGYFNKSDAVRAGIGVPEYYNLSSYRAYLTRQAQKLSKL